MSSQRTTPPGQGAALHKADRNNDALNHTTAGPADKLLNRLDGLRDNGRGRWMARCPAHDDRSPSLSIRETDDGIILLRCFAGCSAADMLAAVGLELRDLFPEPLGYHRPA